MIESLKNTFFEKDKGTDGGNFDPALPPWGSSANWFEANRSLDHLIRLNRAELKRARMLARGIQVYLGSIFSFLDDLCAVTCLFCPDPCCLVAKVWIDFKDLLFLHLSGQQIPQSQPLQDLKNTCQYASPRGCTLKRIVRPWICTWYLCPVQVANFRQQPLDVQETFNQTVKAVKTTRKEMEAEFIQVTVR